MADRDRLTRLVVLGAPAGAIATCERLLASLPTDFPAPVILCQHADGNGTGRPVNILRPGGGPVVRALAGVQTLQPGTVYVLPPGQRVDFTAAAAAVRAESGPGPTPSIDHLFAGAAAACGEDLVAVLLPGTAADGAEGARRVRRRGGLVIVEKPAGAGHADWPYALAPSAVDIAADLDGIGRLLVSIVGGGSTAGHTGEDDLGEFLEGVRARSGIDFNGYKRPSIERRLRRRLVATGTQALAGYQAYLDRHPEEYDRLVASFLIQVTDFFRDGDLYEHLREVVLPAVMAGGRTAGRDLRIWSAGCATGEEAYSLAILLCEALGGELEPFRIRLFATDVDRDAVAFARRGIYPASAVARLDPGLVARYFRAEDGQFVAGDRLRSLIVFGQHDLGHQPPLPRTDLVLCRNVLIYFTPQTQQRALEMFAFSLRAGGYLVLGKAETVNPAARLFQRESAALKVYRRVDGATRVPPVGYSPAVGGAKRASIPPRGAGAQQPAAPEVAAGASATTAARLWPTAFRIPVGIAVVNADYDILHINATARDFLDIRTPASGQDLVHLARGLSADTLLPLIDGAIRGQPTRTVGVALAQLGAAPRRVVDILCQPLPAADQESGPLVCVVLVDVTQHDDRALALQQELARERRLSQDTADRMARLQASLGELTEDNERMALENVELRAANRAIAAGQAAIQAAGEEVETLLAELRASRQELETIHQELASTVAELHLSRQDLHARTIQIQELIAARATERRRTEEARARVDVVLASLPLAVLVVDAEGTVRRSNEGGDDFLRQAAAGELRDLAGRVLAPEELPQRRAARGMPFRITFTLVPPHGDPRWYEAIGNPFRDREPLTGVVTIHDVTDTTLRRLQDEFLAMASHELRTPLTAMNLYADMLARHGGDGAQQRLLDELGIQMRRFNLLVNDLTDSVRLHSGRLVLRRESVDLGALVRRAAALAQRMAEGQMITAELPEAAVRVVADPGRLEQVLTNLLDNAMRHATASPRVEVRLQAAQAWAQIEVEDHGPGIPADEMPRLFTRFYRPASPARRRGGLGLGLYIVRELVTAHGGEVTVRQATGTGTIFTVRLPRET